MTVAAQDHTCHHQGEDDDDDGDPRQVAVVQQRSAEEVEEQLDVSQPLHDAGVGPQSPTRDAHTPQLSPQAKADAMTRRSIHR